MLSSYKKAYERARKIKALKQLTPAYVRWTEEGQQVIGAFVSSTEVTSRLSGKGYNVYLFETDEGLVRFSLGATIDGTVSEMFAKGVVYAVTYRGKEKIAGGRSVNRFDIEEIGPIDELQPEDDDDEEEEDEDEGEAGVRRRVRQTAEG